MRVHPRLFLALFAAVLVAPATRAEERKAFGEGQAAPHAERPRAYDVSHYALEALLDLTGRALAAEAAITLAPLHAHCREIRLDLGALQVDGVTREGGGACRYTHEGEVLAIDLGAPFGPGDTLTLRVKYHGAPTQGLYFVGPDEGYPDKPVQCWSQGETDYNHHWFPCWDAPNDLATSEVRWTVPAGFTAVGNGRLAGVDKGPGKWTWHWKMDVPHVAYLCSVCVGKFLCVAEDVDGVRLEAWVPEGTPDAEGAVRRSFGKTAAMIRFFATQTGVAYPYPRYAQTCVDDFLWGGMENITATTLTTDTLHSARAHDTWDSRSESLVAHELAHQWFGDLCTCRTWGHIWLNEGFASYYEALWTRVDDGEDAFRAEMRDAIGWYKGEDAEYRRPVVTECYADADDLFDGHTYSKGARILYMLHEWLGDAVFRDGVKRYLTTHRHAPVTTDDLRRAMETASGKDLEWYFDQWCEKPGFPEVHVAWTWDDEARAVVLTVKQTQDGADGTPVFRFPVTVDCEPDPRFIGAGGKGDEAGSSHRIWVDAREARYVLPVAFRPIYVRFDRHDVVLKTLTFPRPVAELAALLSRERDVTGRLEAAAALGDDVEGKGIDDRTAAIEALGHALKSDTFHGVRAACASALADYGGGAVPALVAALADPDARVRRAATAALGQAAEGDIPAVEPKLVAALEQDPSDRVRAAAVSALAALKAPKAAACCLAALGQDSHREMVRGAGLDGLVTLEHPEALERAMNASRYGAPARLRGTAVGILERLGKGNPDVIRHLIALCRDPYIWTRNRAIDAVRGLAVPEALPVLRERAAAEFDGRLQRAVRKAIQAIESAQKPAAPADPREQRIRALEAESEELRHRARRDSAKSDSLAREAEALRAEAALEKATKAREALGETKR